jgi:CO/xanthine dehydrogenase Mo-binding subunit
MAESTQAHFKVIGTRPIRHDGVDKVTGRAKYGADKFGIDDVMRQIPDHCHIHARPIRRWQY